MLMIHMMWGGLGHSFALCYWALLFALCYFAAAMMWMVGDPKRQPLWVLDVWSQSCDLTSKTQDERLSTALEKTLRYELTVGIQEEAQDIIT